MITMIKKELKELVITYKLLLTPIVFALVAIMTPISIKMLPELMKNTSDLPAGSVIQIPEPNLTDMLNAFFNSALLPVMIIITLLLMGSIANERSSGVASLVLVKPISTTSYFMSKLIVNVIFLSLSYLIGHGIALYYVGLLSEGLILENCIKGCLYVLPLVFMLSSITLFYSSFMKSQLGAAGLSLLTSFALLNIPQYINKWFATISPNELLNNGSSILLGSIPNSAAYPIICTLLLGIIFSIASCIMLKKQEF